MQACCASANLEHTRQQARTLEPALDAVVHRRPNPEQPLARLRLGSKRRLVRKHDLVHLEAFLPADAEQVGPGLEVVAHPHVLAGVGIAAELGSAHDEAAASRIELFAVQHLARGAERRKAHSVRMQRQRLIAVKEQIERLVEGDLVPPREAQASAGADLLKRRLDRRRIDRVRSMAGETERSRRDRCNAPFP